MNSSHARPLLAAVAAVSIAARTAHTQTPDTAPRDSASGRAERLQPVVVTAGERAGAISSLPDVRGTMVFAGKKTQVLRLDSLNVNTAQDVTREVIGRVPGANITESQSSGFPSNGIGFRGLAPIQSVEMNVRQDGVNIVADLYGYPETYYAPPAEAVERVELVRGSSSLQFGPQFGGVVNYVLRDGTPNSAPTVALRQTGGSFGLFNSFLSVGGGTDRLTYFGYAQYRGQSGWRPNSDLRQVSAAGRLRYRASDRVRLSVEYSLLRNRIHMPGGLDDSAFAADPRQSFRARNWLASPWNIASASADIDLGRSTRLTSTLSYMFSQRYLVWRNEDGGAGAPDAVDPETMQFVPREVEREHFDNVTSETRLLHSYRLFGGAHSLATGVRVFAGDMHRQSGGPGTTGSDFDMSLTGAYEKDVRFHNTNVALFAENVFRVGSRLTLTPGARLELLRSSASGHTDTAFTADPRSRTFVLAGAGAQYQLSPTTDLYANVTQAYRPIEYSYLTPFASLTRIDPHLKDPRGYNADIGWRGTLGRALSFDIGAFWLAYHDRIGLVSGVDQNGVAFTERRNVANSEHRGLESYVELRPFELAGTRGALGTLTLFDALGWTRARYTTGEFAGRTVEYAPDIVNRAGFTYEIGRLTATFQASHVSRQFTDANNTVVGDDSDVGLVPAYTVMDVSARWRLDPRKTIALGVDNLADRRYFTFRTGEYPGPGIIPAIGRSVYATLGVGF